MKKMPAAKDPTRNVWLQLGFPDAEQHFLKANWYVVWTGPSNPWASPSAPPRGGSGPRSRSFRKFLAENLPKSFWNGLVRFLTALGCRIEIRIGPAQEPFQPAPRHMRSTRIARPC